MLYGDILKPAVWAALSDNIDILKNGNLLLCFLQSSACCSCYFKILFEILRTDTFFSLLPHYFWTFSPNVQRREPAFPVSPDSGIYFTPHPESATLNRVISIKS